MYTYEDTETATGSKRTLINESEYQETITEIERIFNKIWILFEGIHPNPTVEKTYRSLILIGKLKALYNYRLIQNT